MFSPDQLSARTASSSAKASQAAAAGCCCSLLLTWPAAPSAHSSGSPAAAARQGWQADPLECCCYRGCGGRGAAGAGTVAGLLPGCGYGGISRQHRHNCRGWMDSPALGLCRAGRGLPCRWLSTLLVGTSAYRAFTTRRPSPPGFSVCSCSKLLPREFGRSPLEINAAREYLVTAAVVLLLQCPEPCLRCAVLAAGVKLPFRRAAAGRCPL